MWSRSTISGSLFTCISASLLFLLHFFGLSKASSFNAISDNLSQTTTLRKVIRISQQTTVRVMGKSIFGSGVIVAQQGQVYRLITNAHVVPPTQGERFNILTFDEQVHQAEREPNISFNTVDLAVLKFQSTRQYSIAPISQYPYLKKNDISFVAGFPNYEYQDGNWKDTTNSGINAYRFTTGHISLLLDKSLEEGYQLGLSNNIIVGMSGGPVFNTNGYLIGILGRTQFAAAGAEAYKFADGTPISEDLLEQMEAASWAIPIIYVSQRKLFIPGLRILQ